MTTPHSTSFSRRLALTGFAATAALTLQGFPIITSVVETGGDNEATDTVTAKWTGVTFSNGIAGEFLDPFTVPKFGEDVPAMVDRLHQWNGASDTVPLPSYLVGGEYIMIGNDNRDNTSLRLAVTVSEPAVVYLLIDNRLTDGNAGDPPESGNPPSAWTGMAWVATQGFEPVLNGLNRTGDANVPDEVGVDEGGDGVGPGVAINNWSSVYSKQVPAGSFTLLQADNAGRNMYGVVVTRLPGSTNTPPAITDLVPTNNALFYNAAGGLRFNASTVAPNSIAPGSVRLFLNGEEVSSNLTVGGNATARTASYTSLQPDTLYNAQIVVSDQAGRSTTNDFAFDTLNAASVVMIEAEDYNYEGGKFQEPAAAGGYANLTGTVGTDYHDNNLTALAGQYRTADYVGLAAGSDASREKFGAAGAADYQVTQVQAGDWLNYTRVLASNTYAIYLRASGTAAQQVRLERVGGAAGFAAPFALGAFLVPKPGGPAPFAYVPLADGFGKPVTLSLSGTNTLRLTALSANLDLQLNYLLLKPVAAGPRPPYLSLVSPAPGAANVALDAVVKVTLANGATTVAPGSVSLSFNGNDVTSAATATATAEGVLIAYDPPGLLATNTAYPVKLVFADSGGTSFTNQWSFTSGPSLPVIPANYGTPLSSGQGNGFRLKIRKAPNFNGAGAAFTLANTALRAEQQLADQIIDPDTTLPYYNEAGGPNSDGLATNNVVNFQQTGTTAGYFPGDLPFPHIDPAQATDPNNIAMEATAYLELTAGIHRLGVRSDDGFKVTAGPVFTDTNLVLGLYEGGRGDGLPGGATEFDVRVEASGIYPIRLIWYEGNGGASLEFYSVDRDTFTRTLINDRSAPAAIKAFVSRSAQVFVPTVSITSPAAGASYPTGPTNLTVTADASVVNGRIAKVEFFYGGTNKIGEAVTAPYAFAWPNVAPGRYTLTAKATDTNNLSTVSAPVRIVVGTPVSVNFQAATATTPEGYLPDTGEVFGDRGNGYHYGWDVDNTANARERNDATSPDKRYDTLNHLQKPLPAGRFWEIELPNGRYSVYAVSGDPPNTDSVYDLQAEGISFVVGTPNADVRWYDGWVTVTVSDGRLTLGNGPTASNNKVCFVDIFALPAEQAKPEIKSINVLGGNVTIQWINGGTLQASPSLTAPAWTDVKTGGTHTEPATSAARFYRVRR